MKTRMLAVLLIVVMLSVSGCYWNRQVESSEVGLKMDDGVSIAAVVGPGRYTNMSWFGEMKILDVSAKTLEWSDPDLVTKDKQPIGIAVGVTYARLRDSDSVKHMWSHYNSEAIDDASLALQVANRIARSVKEVTTSFTLDEMLGVALTENTGRGALTSDFFDKLSPELAEIGVELLDAGVNNIAPSAEYLALLERKANSYAQVDLARQQTLTLQEEFKQEQAQTEIDLEVARRANLVKVEEGKAYAESEQLMELRRLELLTGILGESDKVYFVPQGTDLTLFLAGQSEAAPVAPQYIAPQMSTP